MNGGVEGSWRSGVGFWVIRYGMNRSFAFFTKGMPLNRLDEMTGVTILTSYRMCRGMRRRDSAGRGWM